MGVAGSCFSTTEKDWMDGEVLPADVRLNMSSELICPYPSFRIGYWLAEKKIRKLNFEGFEIICRYALSLTNQAVT